MIGPRDMFAKPMDDIKNTYTGHVEKVSMPQLDFETQRRTFASYGYAIDPVRQFSGNGETVYIGNKEMAKKYGGANVLHDLPDDLREQRSGRKRRLVGGDVSNVESFLGTPFLEELSG